MKRLLCIWLPNWPIQRLRNESGVAAPDRPVGGAEPPIVLWQDDPRRGRRVVACCPRSVSLGVRPGMPISEAEPLACAAGPRARIERHDVGADLQSLARITCRLQAAISPLMAIETLDDHPWAGQPLHHSESLLGDITGIAHLFGGEAGLLRATEALLASDRLTVRMAIADSIGAAWAVAHYASARRDRSDPKSTGTDSEDCQSVCSGVIVPPGMSRQRVASLPIEGLRLALPVAQTLHRLGIRQIEPLLQLPQEGLGARFGKALLRRIEQATAEIDEPLSVHRGPADHCGSAELEYPTTDLEILADRIGRLLEKIRTGLAARNRGALRLTCRLDLAIHPPLILKVGLFAPTLDVEHLTRLVLHQLENRRLPEAVIRLSVRATLTAPLRSRQASLFEEPLSQSGPHPSSGSGVSRLIDSLSGRLGRNAVLGVTLGDDPLPEHAYAVRPLTGNPKHGPRSRRPASIGFRSPPHSDDMSAGHLLHTPSWRDAMRRPLALLAEPIPLVCESVLDGDQHQLPEHFRLEGIVHRIVHSWGPERIETGWWSGPSIGRDYYRIETERGLWWWIFRHLDSTSVPGAAATPCRWMLHGRFL